MLTACFYFNFTQSSELQVEEIKPEIEGGALLLWFTDFYI